jgi:hypothetical protein
MLRACLKHRSSALVRYLSVTSSAHKAAEPVIEEEDTLRSVLQAQLHDIKAAGTFKIENVITTPQSASVGACGACDWAALFLIASSLMMIPNQYYMYSFWASGIGWPAASAPDVRHVHVGVQGAQEHVLNFCKLL